MKGTTIFLIMEMLSPALTVINILFMIYFKHWCNDEFTTPAAWIQSLSNNMLHEGWVLITCSVIKKTYGPIYNFTFKVLTICLSEPSYAFSIMVYGFIWDALICIFTSIYLDTILRTLPLSMNIFPMRQSLHLIVMYRGLLCLFPSTLSLSFIKYK
jgi:hypothetical protein